MDSFFQDEFYLLALCEDSSVLGIGFVYVYGLISDDDSESHHGTDVGGLLNTACQYIVHIS